MAAGRYGGYRHREIRDREFDSDVSGRKDLYGNGYHDGDRKSSRGLDLRDRIKDRRRDVKETEPLNGYHRFSPLSGGSGSGGSERKRRRLVGRSVDREPGELSSESGSDDPEAPLYRIKDCPNGSLPPRSSKRRFPPVVNGRHREQTSIADASVIRNDPVILPHRPAPPNLSEMTKPLSKQSPLSIGTNQDQLLVNGREPGEMGEEEGEKAPARYISASRWAYDAHEDGKAQGYDAEAVPKVKRTTPPTYSADEGLHKKNPSPEFGEVVLRDGYEGTRSKSSSDEDGERENQRDKSEVDVSDSTATTVVGEGDNEDVSDHVMDVDSDDEVGRIKTPASHRSLSMLQGCRSVDEYERLNKINEGTYGVVYRARDKKTGEIVALKKVKMEKEREGFPLTSLREINILLSLRHQSIVGVKEVVVGTSLDSIFMVMQYMDHDLKALMETMKHRYSESQVKCLMLQLLEGVEYLHDNWVIHRDLKTSNILLNNCGELKICDFGLSRQYGNPLKPYTRLVVTLWYRAPELLLGAKEYSTAIDMWSLGCIMAEVLTKEPLFSGKTECDQLDKIFRILGTPNEETWPGFTNLPGAKVRFVKQPPPTLG